MSSGACRDSVRENRAGDRHFGYIGLHCARELLEQGHQVRGSVRSTEAEAIAKFTLARSVPRGESVELFRTNLLRDDGWCEAMEGCDAVLHVASPFIMGEPRHPDDLIKPAVEGTARVMRLPRLPASKGWSSHRRRWR